MPGILLLSLTALYGWGSAVSDMPPLIWPMELPRKAARIKASQPNRPLMRYAGNPSFEFDCTLWLGEQRIRAWLIYYPAQSRWGLNYLVDPISRIKALYGFLFAIAAKHGIRCGFRKGSFRLRPFKCQLVHFILSHFNFLSLRNDGLCPDPPGGPFGSGDHGEPEKCAL